MWKTVLQFLDSPVGQQLLQSSEAAVVAAIAGMIKHAHQQSEKDAQKA